MLTTARLIELLLVREGFKERAYDDARPWIELEPDDEIEGTLTYGPGLTRRDDGSPLEIGDTISEQESRDRVARYIRKNVEPALENLIHVALTGFQYDALGSLIYQYGEPEVAGWRLIRRVNAGEGWEAIALEWINGTVFWRGKPAFWTRRVSELLMFFGLDWRAGENVTPENDVLTVIEEMGFDGQLPKPGPVHTPVEHDLFDEAYDPTPETPLTTDDLNHRQLERMRGAKIPLSRMTKRVPIAAVEYLDNPEPEVKPIEDSQRGKGYAKTQTGKELGAAGVIGTGAVAVGAVEPVVAFVDKYPKDTILWVFVVLSILGVGYYMYGEWQRQKGEDEATDVLG